MVASDYRNNTLTVLKADTGTGFKDLLVSRLAMYMYYVIKEQMRYQFSMETSLERDFYSRDKTV